MKFQDIKQDGLDEGSLDEGFSLLFFIGPFRGVALTSVDRALTDFSSMTGSIGLGLSIV